eukprot:s768_g24.t1
MIPVYANDWFVLWSSLSILFGVTIISTATSLMEVSFCPMHCTRQRARIFPSSKRSSLTPFPSRPWSVPPGRCLTAEAQLPMPSPMV